MPAQPKRRNIAPEVSSARGRVAGLTQAGASPDLIEAARADLREANAEAALNRFLTPEAQIRLARRILAGGGNGT
jgi:hypothetical protein